MAPDEGTTAPDTARAEAAEAWASRTCARCGRPFLCGAETSSCWCDLVTLTDEQRARLAELKLTGCLCRECLEAL
jgi:hypothetical protein